MTNLRHPGLWLLMLIMSACTSISKAQEQPVPELVLDLVFLDPAGDPITDFEVTARLLPEVEGFRGVAGLVDQNGALQLSLPVPSESGDILFAVSPGHDPNAAMGELTRRYKRYWEDLRPQYHWSSYYRIPVVADQQHASMAVTFNEGVTVTGRMVDGATQPLDAYVEARGVPECALTPAGRDTFVLSCVEKASDVLLFVQDETLIVPIELTAQQTASSIDIGDVIRPDLATDATAVITVDFQDWDNEPDGTFQNTLHGVSLIASDGTYVVDFLARSATGQAVRGPKNLNTQLAIPAGTYYLVGGTFTPHRDVHHEAFRLITTGQAGLVEGWPVLTVDAGESAEVSFAAADVDALILAASPGF